MVRRAYPPGAADHPLRRLNPHQCVPFLGGLFSSGREGKLDALPSPRLMNTHMPLAMVPRAAPVAAGSCTSAGIPRTWSVSLWHYLRTVYPDVTLHDVFESACDGAIVRGPFWDHIAGYRRASESRPDNVLFLLAIRLDEIVADKLGAMGLTFPRV
ncbi:hypothetical protein ACP70R_003696 [Stipagrostis hirtigluma subsp. patula]